MTVGSPRKPTKELELSGAFVKHPERTRERENESKPDSAVSVNPAVVYRY
jgi:hypothetical protein